MPRRGIICCVDNGELFASQHELSDVLGVNSSSVSTLLRRGNGTARWSGLTFTRESDAKVTERNRGKAIYCPQTARTYATIRRAFGDPEVKKLGRSAMLCTMETLPRTSPYGAPTVDDTLPRCGCGGKALFRSEYDADTIYQVRCANCGMATPVSLNDPEPPRRIWRTAFDKKGD